MKNKFRIHWCNVAANETVAIDILNALGQIIYHSVAPASHQKEVTVSDWPRGVYFVKMHSSNGLKAEKLIVE